MDSRQLIYFLRVCEYSNITQAAQSLYISPQALSKAIARLEDEFRMPLFLRTVHGLVLTEAGKLLQKLGQPIADSLDDLSLRMSGLYQQTHHHFTLGITSTLDFFLGEHAFDMFCRAHPTYTASFAEYTHSVCETYVSNGFLVAALTYGSVSRPGLELLPLFKRQWVCVMTKDSPLAQRNVIHIQNLKGMRLVGSVNPCSLQTLHDACKKIGFVPNIYLADDTLTTLHLCSEHGYIGITTDHLLFRASIQNPHLAMIPISIDEFPYPINLIVNSELFKQKIVQDFISCVKQVALLRQSIIPQYGKPAT